MTAVPSTAIVQPGRNCWRVEQADRFYCIQDAADYFRLVRQAILSAHDTVFILGWDIFAAVDLVPGSVASDAPTRFDELLAFAARRRPHLRCYILIWDYAALYTLERDPFSRWRLRMEDTSTRRVRFRRSSSRRRLPPSEGHRRRRSAGVLRRHRSDQPSLGHERAQGRGAARKIGTDEPYGPYHEVQAMATGPLAASLGVIARDRWRALGEKRLPRRSRVHARSLAVGRHAGSDRRRRRDRPDLTGIRHRCCRSGMRSALSRLDCRCEAIDLHRKPVLHE